MKFVPKKVINPSDMDSFLISIRLYGKDGERFQQQRKKHNIGTTDLARQMILHCLGEMESDK